MAFLRGLISRMAGSSEGSGRRPSCHEVTQIADFFGGKSAILSAQFQLGVSESLEDLTEVFKVLFPCGGEHDDIIEIEEARFPVETGEDTIHEAGEGGGSIAEAKWNLVELEELATASTKSRFFLVPLLDRDLPVSTLEIKSGKPAGVEEVVDAGERMSVFDGGRVELSKVYAKA